MKQKQSNSPRDLLAIEYLPQPLAELFPGWDDAAPHQTCADAALLRQTIRDLDLIWTRGSKLPRAPKHHCVIDRSLVLTLARTHAELHEHDEINVPRLFTDGHCHLTYDCTDDVPESTAEASRIDDVLNDPP
ncbi:hypothetical protein [Paraburkholderia sp. PGU19]|uniref:hypothetical protein n=1 Tax=Paraburkholderia sp. PGU19 TaxID=2735434 RepID=UPI0015DB8156|nr:hypothetical protein [Paraburkholderia sp. PGU19]